MQTKYRDYAGLFPNYQALGNQKAQSYQNNANTVGQLLQALSAIAQKNQMMSEADNYFSGGVTNAPTMKPNFGQQGAMPIGENFDGQVAVQGRTVMPNPMMAEPSISPRSQDPQTLIRGLMNANPEIARRAQAGIQGIQLQAPNRQALSPYGTEDVNPLSPTRGQRTEPIEKPTKFSTGFSDFLQANSNKYESMPNGLEQAYKDYQSQGMDQFKKKEETKAQFRAKKDGKAISSYVSENGYKMTLWRNPDGEIVEIPSNEKVRETQQSPTLQKEDVKLSQLQELSKTIREQAKPDYLGGVASGLAGQGFGGLTGGVREATGLISDEEAQFRANVASLKNQLLYLRSGAQINESEFKRLEKELPDPSQPQNVFLNRLNTFDKQVQDILSAKGKVKTPTPKQKTINVNGATITVED